ncbi:unnamed protein product [Lactuca saligna]|uniref:Uncharacterized protein n=1 Tax=Lactuca saligna TaxID=75948 RepID=A0AA36E2X9_LACSI|nr:unnamed protein product [Lactuca saligna]
MIFNEKYPQIDRLSDTLDMKALGPNIFGIMKQSRKLAKVTFQGLKELVKFGRFVKKEGVQATSTPIAIVVEEHVALSRSNLSFLFEVPDDDDDDDDYDDNDNDDYDNNDDVKFHLFIPSKEPVNEAMITPAETEYVINIFKQPDNPAPELMEALIKELQSTARKPPQAVPVTFESPYESYKDEPNASHMTKK